MLVRCTDADEKCSVASALLALSIKVLCSWPQSPVFSAQLWPEEEKLTENCNVESVLYSTCTMLTVYETVSFSGFYSCFFTQLGCPVNVYACIRVAQSPPAVSDTQVTSKVRNHPIFSPNPIIKTATHTTTSAAHPSALSSLFLLSFASKIFYLSSILQQRCQNAFEHIYRRATS